jgi:hypothetical protein
MRRFRPTRLRLAAAIVVGSLAVVGVADAASLGLGSGSLFVWSQTLTKGTCNQTSTTADDTYVDETLPTSNFGTMPTLGVGGGKNKVQEAFIRFDLSACNIPTTGGADSANLTLFVMTGSKNAISVYPVFSSWSESTLTWNGVAALTIGTTATASFTPSTNNTSYTIPVTSDVDAEIKAGAFWGWELVNTGGNKAMTIASAEAPMTTQRPSMTLSYEK